MKDGKYEVGDWVKSSRSMMDITAGKAYRVVEAGEGGFYVLDDVDDENWSQHRDVDWSLCSSGHTYKVGDWVKVIDNSSPAGMEKPIAVGSVVKILRRTQDEAGWMLEGSGIFYYTEDQLEPAEALAPAWVPKVGDKVRIVRKVEREDGWTNGWVDTMNQFVANGVDYTVSDVGHCGVKLAECSFGWPVGALELVKKPAGDVPPSGWVPKVGDRVQSVVDFGVGRPRGSVGTVYKTHPRNCFDVRFDPPFDGHGLGNTSWFVHLDDIKAATTTPITAAAPTDGHMELRLTISLDTSAFADKLQRIVDAIRAAA